MPDSRLQLPPAHPIIEGLVTTVDLTGNVHLRPMGPIVSSDWKLLLLRPYRPSTTLDNLIATQRGVFHISDDASLFARAVCKDRLADIPFDTITYPPVPILADACRWYAFELTQVDTTCQPAQVEARIVQQGRIRDFIGFHRARHAIVEAAILASRTGLIASEIIRDELERLRPLVEKTGTTVERSAFEQIEQSVRQKETRT